MKNAQLLNFHDAGRGNALVLLHGFMESLEIWDDFSKELSSSMRVVSIDLPGHGKSPAFEGAYTMHFMAEKVKEVLDYLEIKACVLIGHSMGGYVTLEFAEHYPEMLKGLGLFHSQAQADTEEGKINRERTIEIIKKDRLGFIQNFIPSLFALQNVELFKEPIEKLKQLASSMEKEQIIAATQAMKNRKSHIETLVNTKVPVLFIAGKSDGRAPLEKILAQAALPNHAELLILSNVVHMGYIEAKNKTMDMVRCFTRKCFKQEC